MLSFYLLYLVFCLFDVWFLHWLWTLDDNPIRAPRRNDIEVPDLTFDTRGFA